MHPLAPTTPIILTGFPSGQSTANTSIIQDVNNIDALTPGTIPGANSLAVAANVHNGCGIQSNADIRPQDTNAWRHLKAYKIALEYIDRSGLKPRVLENFRANVNRYEKELLKFTQKAGESDRAAGTQGTSNDSFGKATKEVNKDLAVLFDQIGGIERIAKFHLESHVASVISQNVHAHIPGAVNSDGSLKSTEDGQGLLGFLSKMEYKGTIEQVNNSLSEAANRKIKSSNRAESFAHAIDLLNALPDYVLKQAASQPEPAPTAPPGAPAAVAADTAPAANSHTSGATPNSIVINNSNTTTSSNAEDGRTSNSVAPSSGFNVTEFIKSMTEAMTGMMIETGNLAEKFHAIYNRGNGDFLVARKHGEGVNEQSAGFTDIRSGSGHNITAPRVVAPANEEYQQGARVGPANTANSLIEAADDMRVYKPERYLVGEGSVRILSTTTDVNEISGTPQKSNDNVVDISPVRGDDGGVNMEDNAVENAPVNTPAQVTFSRNGGSRRIVSPSLIPGGNFSHVARAKSGGNRSDRNSPKHLLGFKTSANATPNTSPGAISDPKSFMDELNRLLLTMGLNTDEQTTTGPEVRDNTIVNNVGRRDDDVVNAGAEPAGYSGVRHDRDDGTVSPSRFKHVVPNATYLMTGAVLKQVDM